MKHLRRTERRQSRRWTAGLAASALVAGLVTMANSAGAAETIVDGEVYGWGAVGAAGVEEPWVSGLPNDDAPFVDVAVDGLSGANHTTLAVTGSGDIVTEGNYGGIVSLIPASLNNKHVIGIEVWKGKAAAITQEGAIVTWANAPAPPAEYQNPSAPTGVIDVQLSDGFGLALKDDGTMVSWGNADFVTETPEVDDIVQIDVSNSTAIAVTAGGDVHVWEDSAGGSAFGLANSVPDAVRDATIVDVSMTLAVAYALTDDGQVLAWTGSPNGVSVSDQFPADQVDSPVVALGSRNGRGNIGGQVALTESGEFVAWGFGTEERNTMRTPPAVDLEGHRVVAFETGMDHSALIFGPEDTEPDPGVVSAPQIDGMPVVGADVTGTPATFNFETTNETNAWYSAPTPETPAAEWTLVGATNPLELTGELEGQYVAYRTTVEDPDGQTWVEDSALIGPIESAPPGVVDVPRIEGAPLLNTQVIGIAATFNFTPASESSAWYRADTADAAPETWELVSDANPLTLATANRDKFLVYRTTATDENGETFTADSEPFGPVIKFSVTQATIQGDPLVGSTITAVPGEFNYPPETTSYGWMIGSQPPIVVPPGGSLDLTLTEEHDGQTIRFLTQGSAAGLSTASISAPFGPVTMPPLSAVEQPQIEGAPLLNTQVIGIPAVLNRTPESVSSAWYRADTADAAPETWELVSDANPLTLATANRDKFLIFRTTATDENGQTIISDSEPFGPVVKFSASQATIQGDPLVGSTITAVPGEFSYPPETTTYAWMIGTQPPVPVPLGGSLDLTLTEEHLGQTIRFLTQGTAAGLNSTSISAAFGPVTLPPLELSGQPTITGQPFIGQTLTATPVATADGVESTFQWFAGSGEEFTAIEGATGETLELTEAQRDQQIKVVQTATRAADDATDTAESAPTSAVTDAPVDLLVEAEAELTGTPIVGETLTGTPATYSTIEDVTITNYWVIGDTEVEAAGTTLVLTDEHVGLNIQFKSVATRGEEAVPSTSAAIGPVLVDLAATAAPTITGTPRVGQTLAGTPATFNDTDGVTVTHQWLADGEPIDGATGTSLVLTEDHLGAAITFASTATRGDEAPVVSVSEATAPVEPADTTPPGGEVVIDLDGPTTPGSTISVNVGTALAGQEVQLYLSNLDRMLSPATVAEDGTIQVLVPGDIQLGTHRLAVYADGDLVGWDDFEVTLVRPEDPAFKDLIDVTPDTVKAGDEVTIQVGADRAGQKVRVVLFSAPTDLGFATVAADGTVRVTIPADMADGVHRVAVYDVDGNLIGWQDITVTDGTGAGTGNGGRFGGLPGTGAEATGVMVPLGLAFLLAGLGLVVYRRRHQLS